jgi:hypothetical protein
MEVEERRPGTRPSGMTGCGQRPRETERAPDPKEINVPARNEQRIGSVQRHGLLCWPACRRPWPARRLGSPPSAPTRCDGCHAYPNCATIAGIPSRRPQPCRIQPSRGSAGGSGWRCWQSHQVPPGHSSWCWWRQDKQIMHPLSRAGKIRPRSPCASGAAAQPTARPRSAHPRYRTSPGGSRHSPDTRRAPDMRRIRP